MRHPDVDVAQNEFGLEPSLGQFVAYLLFADRECRDEYKHEQDAAVADLVHPKVVCMSQEWRRIWMRCYPPQSPL